MCYPDPLLQIIDYPGVQAALAAARATAAGEPLPDLPILKALKPAEPVLKPAEPAQKPAEPTSAKTSSKLKTKKGGIAKRKASLPARAKSAAKQSPSGTPDVKPDLPATRAASSAGAGAASRKTSASKSRKAKVIVASDGESAGTPVKASAEADANSPISAEAPKTESGPSSGASPAGEVPEGLVGWFAPNASVAIAPAVTLPSEEEGDADNNFPLPTAWLQLRGCAQNEAVSAPQLNGFGPRPPYPSVARITVRNIFSGLPITNQAPAAVLPVLAPERQVTAPAAQRRVRSRPGGPAVQPDLAAAPQPVSASALQHPTAASGPEDDSTDDMDVEIAEVPRSDASPGPQTAHPASGAAAPAAATEAVQPGLGSWGEESTDPSAAGCHVASAAGPAAAPTGAIGNGQVDAASQQHQQGQGSKQPFQPPPFDPFQHPQQQQTALLAHFASLPLHQWGHALGDYQRQALASLASNISAVQQVLAQASLLHQASSQGDLLNRVFVCMCVYARVCA